MKTTMIVLTGFLALSAHASSGQYFREVIELVKEQHHMKEIDSNELFCGEEMSNTVLRSEITGKLYSMPFGASPAGEMYDDGDVEVFELPECKPVQLPVKW